MAIRPVDLYPGQIDSAGAYPHGKARNVGTPGDGTGTPLEKAWLNDIWGFLQALLDQNNITPTGDPDSATDSDYMRGLAVFNWGSSSIPLTPSYNQSSRFTVLDSGSIEQSDITDAGKLLVPIPLQATNSGYGRLDEVHVALYGGATGGHAGLLPATLPILSVISTSWNINGAAETAATVLGSTADPSGSAAAYDLIHLISVTGLAANIGTSMSLYARLTGEAGANALASRLRVLGMTQNWIP